jgi:hypothetical protein
MEHGDAFLSRQYESSLDRLTFGSEKIGRSAEDELLSMKKG